MRMRRWLFVALAMLAAPAGAAELGIATLVEGSPRLLRGATWYKLVPGTRVEDGDIVEAAERGQLQLELVKGTIVNLVDGSIYLLPLPAKAVPGAIVLVVPRGWIKAVAKAPGIKLRAASSELVLAAGTAVVQTDGARFDTFVESGNVRLVARSPSDDEESVHEAKQDEFWSKSASGAFVPSSRPPRAFIDAIPRHFRDALPVLATTLKGRPQPTPTGGISYEEAEPWLAGRDRAVFERRFASRLSDRAFRRAVEPDIGRYPSWDRRLHPEKYAPPTQAAPQ